MNSVHKRISAANPIVERINADLNLRRQIIAAFAKAGDPLTVQAINDWKKLKRGVPPGRVKIVSQVMGIPPHKIRPDIYSRPSRPSSSA